MEDMYFSGILGYENKYKIYYDDLIKQTGDGFFINKRDVLIFAALIGFNNYKVEEIENYSVEKNQFKNLSVSFSEYHSVIYSIALCYKQSSEIVINKSKVAEIFNKCAGKGFEKLKEIFLEDGDTILRNFEDFILDPEESIQLYDSEKISNKVLDIIT